MAALDIVEQMRRFRVRRRRHRRKLEASALGAAAMLHQAGDQAGGDSTPGGLSSEDLARMGVSAYHLDQGVREQKQRTDGQKQALLTLHRVSCSKRVYRIT